MIFGKGRNLEGWGIFFILANWPIFFPASSFRFASLLRCAPVCLVTPLRSGCPPWATRLTFPFTMALSRGCSLPLMSPYGLPSAGSVGSHPPGCLTLRAAYAAYRATALLLGSQPAPAGMCSGFQFPVSSLCPPCFSQSKFRLQSSPSVLSVSSVVKSQHPKNWPNGQVVKIGIGLMKKGCQYHFLSF